MNRTSTALETRLFSCFTSGEKVIAGIDGNLFSTLAAWAAKESGAIVEGVALRLYEEYEEELISAERAAKHLGINLTVADYRGFFGEDVLSTYFSALKEGRALSACAFCANRGRIAYLFNELMKQNARKLVTGDIARVAPWKDGYAVYKAKSGADSSRNLALANPLTIPYILMPLGEAESLEELSALAKRLGFKMEEEKEKPCFLNGKAYPIYPFESGVKGVFIYKGETLGAHGGVYTLQLGATAPLEGEYYISRINTLTGDVEVSKKEELYKRNLRLSNTTFRKDEPPVSKVTLIVGKRYKKTRAFLEIFFGGEASLLTEAPVFFPMQGEIAAIYSGERLIGGGVIA
jgi:tRNA U34 2-thiouridine synthase MnmA/TrmU